jgi:RNA exonuclease 1
MGTAISGDSELIRVSMVDFFTSEVLVDKLVFPSTPMLHYNTKYSGVSRQEMDEARKSEKCFLGKKQALEALWRYVDDRTIVIGHSVHNDLNSLRWIHGLVVDSFVIENTILRREKEEQEKQEAKEKRRLVEEALANGIDLEAILGEELEGLTTPQKTEDQKREPRVKGTGPLALKVLTKRRVGRDIQLGNQGHDSTEDALAARDIVLWHVSQKKTKGLDDELEDQLVDLSIA